MVRGITATLGNFSRGAFSGMIPLVPKRLATYVGFGAAVGLHMYHKLHLSGGCYAISAVGVDTFPITRHYDYRSWDVRIEEKATWRTFRCRRKGLERGPF